MRKIIQSVIIILMSWFSLPSDAQVNLDEIQQVNLEVVDSIYSKTLDSYRHFWVRLPDNYNPKSAIKYPVVYLLDGFSLKENLEVVYNNYWGHYLPHMILVGISNSSNRTRDLTTSKVESRRGSSFNYETGGAERFTSFIENELIPNIDKNYPTTNFRTLIGHSYAGLFTINVLLNHSHLFKNYIVIDPSLDWDDQKLLKQAKAELKTKSLEEKGLFIALAAEQLHMSDGTITIDNLREDDSEFTLFSRSILEFCDIASSTIKQNRLNFDWEVYPEDLHGTVPLPAMRDGLVSLFKWYQFKSPQTYNNFESPIEELKKLLKEQEIIYNKNFGYKVAPMAEELFVGYGQMYAQTGQGDKAKLFLNKAIEYYPNSSMGYEALAEYYEMNNEKKEAIRYLRLAYNINKNEQLLKRIKDLKKN